LLSNESWKRDFIKIEIPNAARVAGFLSMFQLLICNKHFLENAQNSESKQLEELDDHALTESECIGMGQIECILKKMTALSCNIFFELQDGKVWRYMKFTEKSCLFQS
jgi:hypothetical protein